MRALGTLTLLAALAGSARAEGRALSELLSAAGPEAASAFAFPVPLFPFRLLRRALDNPWARAKTPSPGPAEAIGFYSAGCLKGGAALAAGPGYELMRPSRNRHYGHPDLVGFVSDLAAGAGARGLGRVLVGDLGQPRGGPTLTGHASHQSGLDADVWFLLGADPLTPEQRETLPAPRVVVPDFEGLDSAHWRPEMLAVLKLAAEDARAERIFVNPVVKREACRVHPGEAWLGKLRPWWGHDDHFHARLRCPAGDASCRAQEPGGEGEGCGEDLDEWFTPARKKEARRRRARPSPAVLPRLPAACKAVLAAP